MSNLSGKRKSKLAEFLTEKQESHYTRIQKYKLFIATYNVNGRVILDDERNEFGSAFLACDAEAPDLYAIGFQELGQNAEAFLNDEYQKEEYWTELCYRSLHPDKEYEILEKIRFVGMYLIIFVNKELTRQELIKNVQKTHLSTGISRIFKTIGNKGAVAIRFELHNTSVCFVNCHLAPFMNNWARRNENFRKIRSRLEFGKGEPQVKRIEDHDQVYWFGDLNYRVPLPYNVVIKKCAQDDLKPLLQNDQLKRGKKHRQCFNGYREGGIWFQPTYKFDPGTHNWDTSEKQRVPAWCDRVLWKGEGIKQIMYRSHPVLRSSDHKPVSALFTSSFRVEDPVIKQELFQRKYRDLRVNKNMIQDNIPNVTVDKNVVNFGDVHFSDYSLSRTMTLFNDNKKSWIKFSFKPAPEWLIVRPLSGRIPAGKCIRISLELKYYAKFMIKCLNNSWFNMNHELVLCIPGAKSDIKIQVNGNYIPSSFGCPMEKLIQFHRPISEVPRDEITITRYPTVWSDSFDPIPRELDILLNFLEDYKTKPALFLAAGWENEFTTIRRALDQNRPELLKDVSFHSVADATLLFIQYIPERVIQFNFYTAVVRAKENFDMCREVINSLSPVHRNVFNRIIGFLRELCRHTDQNNLNAHIIAKIFGPLMIRIHKPDGRTPNGSLSGSSDESDEDGVELYYPNGAQFTNGTQLTNGYQYRTRPIRLVDMEDEPENNFITVASSKDEFIVTAHQTKNGIIKFNPRQNFIYQFLINDYEC